MALWFCSYLAGTTLPLELIEVEASDIDADGECRATINDDGQPPKFCTVPNPSDDRS